MEFCKCTFFGHRDAPPGIKASLRQVLSDLIERQGVKQFYVGNQGSFDTMARNLLTEFEQTHGISYEIVLAYLPIQEDPLCDFFPCKSVPKSMQVPFTFAPSSVLKRT